MCRNAGLWSGALIVFTLTACSGGSDPAPPAFNATGHWMTWLTDPTAMEENGPYGNYVSQTGANVDGVGMTGTVSGNNLSLSVDIGFAVLTFNGTMSGSEISGNYGITGFPGTAPFRMQQFTPTGSLSGTGTVGGLTVAVSSTSAFCERYYSDINLTNLTSVNVIDDDGVMRFELDFQNPSNLAVGTLDASVEPVVVIAGDDTTRNTIQATSGTVTITQYDATGFVATYDLMLPASESISGSFDVVFDIDAYDPP